MTVKQSQVHVPRRGRGISLSKTNIFQHCLWTQNKNRWHFCMKLWRLFSSGRTSFLTNPPKPDTPPPQHYILLRVNFCTSTRSRPLRSSKVLQDYTEYILAGEYSFHVTLYAFVWMFWRYFSWIGLVGGRRWKKLEEAKPHTLKEYGFTFPARHLHQA